MILSLLAAALVAQPLPDACAPIDPAAHPDPQAAADYRTVGDEERAAGRLDSAAAAYRAALDRDPDLTPARAALAELCATQHAEAAFTLGLARLRAGDCRGALPALEEARAAADPAAALLVGLCLYRQGEDAPAAAALNDALTSPETRASAELYLGLLALRRGEPSEASPLFDAAAFDPALAPVARALSRQARRDGRIVLSLLSEAGWDSNVGLLPGGSLAPTGTGDGLASAAAVLSVAPWLERGPYLRGEVTLRKQLQLHAFDVFSFAGAAGVSIGSAERQLLLEYGYESRRVGGDPFLSVNRALAEGRMALGRGWSAGLSYALRSEQYDPADAADDSGVLHAGQIDATATVRSFRLTLAARAGWHGARTDARAYRELGPLLAVSSPAAAPIRAVLELSYTWRDYLAADPGFDVQRSDAYLDAAARLELDLHDRWTLFLSLACREAFSNVDALHYGRLVATAGISFTAGVL